MNKRLLEKAKADIESKAIGLADSEKGLQLDNIKMFVDHCGENLLLNGIALNELDVFTSAPIEGKLMTIAAAAKSENLKKTEAIAFSAMFTLMTIS